MPTYDYVCAKCGHAFEKVQSMKDDALTVCPKEVCPGKKWGKGKVNRQVGSGAGLIFKGSGFYITDYPKGDKGSAPKSDGGKSDRAAKADKPDASGNSEKPEKAEKTDKADTSAKTEKSTPSTDSSSSSSSTTSSSTSSSTPSAPSPSSTKD